MNTKQMRYFVAVAEELNFRKAAEGLHMSQPPLSQQIAALEESVGTRLFVRDRRKVALTPAGVSLLKDVRRILADMDSAARRAADLGQGRVGTVRLGYVGPAIDGPLPERLAAFRDANPGAELELHETFTVLQLDRLRTDQLDAGVVRIVGHDLSGLATRLFVRDRYVLAVPESHELAERKSVSVRDLDGQPLILFPRAGNPTLHDAWTALFSNAGSRCRVVQEAATKHTAVALAAAGLGLAPVPGTTAGSGRKGVRFVALEGAIPTLELHVAWRPDRESPLRDALVAALA